MTFEAPQVGAAPTRRSNRTSTAPVTASTETLGVSRAELRRRSHRSASASATTDAAPAAASEVLAPAASASPDSLGAPAPAAPVPLSRRAARAQRLATRQQPVVVAEPAMEPVLVAAEPFELIEPAADAATEDTVPAPQPQVEASEASEPSVADAFEAAARLFSFTGETPVQIAAAAVVGEPGPTAEDAPRVAARRTRADAVKRIAATSFSVGVVGIVGLLTVGMTTPVAAVAAAQGSMTTVADITAESSSVLTAAGNVEVDPDEIQAYVAPAEIESETVDRHENYATVSMAQVASELGISNPSSFYVNDPNAAIQWPFAVGVGITFGFGMRDGRMHEGADFVPGNGSHVQAVADGTVRIATTSGGAYGVQVVIDHIIDGELVSTRYAHLQYDSLQVSPGQQVTVGTFLGRTGNTGRSFGAHTHFEVLKGGTTAIDPIAWLRNNAGRYTLG